MKSEKRKIYRDLISLPQEQYGLCNICKYALFIGNCQECELECHCGVEKVEFDAEDVWQGSDCWMFSPRWSLADIADRVGIYLQGKIPDMSNCKDYMPQRVSQ